MMASQSTELLHLYRRLLRSCATYPSKNRWGIYEAIREEFRDNRTMNPDDPKTQKQIQVAYKGLGQLRMYDTVQLVSIKKSYSMIINHSFTLRICIFRNITNLYFVSFITF